MSIQIIAEIGTAHGASLETAKRLVDAAVDSGADCVKFQWVYADEILHPETGFVSLPTGNIRLYDRFKELEVKPEFFAEIKAYVESKGAQFLCTPFGLRSAKELLDLHPSAIKIASPELNHFPLLHFLSQYDIPLILSTGVSLLCDIEKALHITQSVSRRVLLHCVTSYPAPEEEYNVRLLQTYAALFGIPVGISDHSLDPMLIPVLSVACGACVIEKHITLSKTTDGLDDPVALIPQDFKRMTEAVRKAEKMESKDCILLMSERYGSDRIERILGSGQKALAPSEYDNYGRTNRSIHFVKDLPAYAVIKEGDIALLRTEKVLSVGISSDFFDLALGAVLAKKAVCGEGLTWEHIVRQ